MAMNPTYAAWRLTFRNLFNIFHIKTRKVLVKDLKCLWVVMHSLLNDLSDHLHNNGDLDSVEMELIRIYVIVLKSNETIDKISNKYQKENMNEADREMLDKVTGYSAVLAMTAFLLGDLQGKVQKECLSEDDIGLLKSKNFWPVMSNHRVKEFLTEPFMQKTFILKAESAKKHGKNR